MPVESHQETDLAAIRKVIIAASPERPMLWGRTKPTSHDDVIAEIAVAIRRGPEIGATIVHFPVEDDGDGATSVFVAITGNGPRSQANAEYIVNSFDPVLGWGACVDEIEVLRKQLNEQSLAAFDARQLLYAEIERLKSEIDAWRTVAK